jgi:NADPH-dependent 7-cyano-7-deazaguanine reductase QueF
MAHQPNHHTMTNEILEALIDYIDARIAMIEVSNSSDGGLAESITAENIKEHLFELIHND